MVTTFHQILSFYIVPWPAKIQVHWVNGTLRNCGRTGLALSTPALSAFQLFLWIFSTPGLPFTTASLVIYGNPCGMQEDGYSIFIENYQSEDLGSIHRRSKPSLHLPDSFRLKISENLWKSRHKNLPEILRNCFFLHKGSYWSRYLSTPGWHSQLDIRRITMSLSWLRRLFSIHCHVSIQHMLGLNWSFFLTWFDSHRTKINTSPAALVWLSELIKVRLRCCTIKIALKILLSKSGLSERIKVSLRRCTWGPWLEFLWAGLQTEQRLKRSWRRSQSKRRIELGHY